MNTRGQVRSIVKRTFDEQTVFHIQQVSTSSLLGTAVDEGYTVEN